MRGLRIGLSMLSFLLLGNGISRSLDNGDPRTAYLLMLVCICVGGAFVAAEVES